MGGAAGGWRREEVVSYKASSAGDGVGVRAESHERIIQITDS